MNKEVYILEGCDEWASHKVVPDSEKYVKASEIRKLIANYMYAEGCECCRNVEQHRKWKEEIAKLLDVEAYDDNSGYDFTKYEEKDD